MGVTFLSRYAKQTVRVGRNSSRNSWKFLSKISGLSEEVEVDKEKGIKTIRYIPLRYFKLLTLQGNSMY